MENRITSLFGIRYPIVAGGMIFGRICPEDT